MNKLEDFYLLLSRVKNQDYSGSIYLKSLRFEPIKYPQNKYLKRLEKDFFSSLIPQRLIASEE